MDFLGNYNVFHCFLTIQSFAKDGYGWKELGSDYIAIINDAIERIEQNSTNGNSARKKSKLKIEEQILATCDYLTPEVRIFAHKHTSDLKLSCKINEQTYKIPLLDKDSCRIYWDLIIQEFNNLNDKIEEYKKLRDEAYNKWKTYKYDYYPYRYRSYYNSSSNKKYYKDQYDEYSKKVQILEKYREDNTQQLKKVLKADTLYREHRTILQCFSLFKYIKNNWHYVSDPHSENYFAKASESILSLSGDCDDYSILLASCIQAIGGEARIVLTNDHAFPELKVNKKVVDDLLSTFFEKEVQNGNRSYYFHNDSVYPDIVWLNMDYTGNHPGSKWYKDSFNIRSIVNLTQNKKIEK